MWARTARPVYAQNVAQVLCLDFDDTIVENNISRAVLERFADPAWQVLADAFRRAELSVEEYNTQAMDLVAAEEDEIVAFARSVAVPRPGLVDLVRWAESRDWLPIVVSNSLDILVGPILDDLGLGHLGRHVGRARKRYRWRVRYLSPRGIELAAGFKLSYVKAFQSAGDFVAYAGDGASDVEAATIADAVFARSTLLERLEGRRPRVYPFESFFDVLATMRTEAEGWL